MFHQIKLQTFFFKGVLARPEDLCGVSIGVAMYALDCGQTEYRNSVLRESFLCFVSLDEQRNEKGGQIARANIKKVFISIDFSEE